jgi:hypothetical protein
MKVHDFNDLILSPRNGNYGGASGSKEGVIINNEFWIIKYPGNTKKLTGIQDMSYTSSPVSEFLGSHIYAILGYAVHQTLLGIRNGHLVVACKDLCAEGETLIEFRQLKNTYNRQLQNELDTTLHSTGVARFVDLHEVMIHLKYNPELTNVDGLPDRFWDCVIVDGFINLNSRV